MNKFIIALISISIAATSSCSFIKNGKIDTVKAEKAAEQKPKRERPAIKKPTVGDKVVARWAPQRWAEGRVDGINESRSEAMPIPARATSRYRTSSRCLKPATLLRWRRVTTHS